MKSTDFSGITINSGIDAHLNQWNVSVYVESLHFKTFQQDSDPEILSKYLRRNFPGGTYKSAYEAGYFGYSAHRKLEKLGIANIVITPSDIPTTDKEKKRKNDRVDAKKIARGLVYGDLKGIYIPTREEEADRALVRLRITKYREDLTRTKQRIKAFLARIGIRSQDLGWKGNWSITYVKKIEELEFEYGMNSFYRDELICDYKTFLERMNRVDRQIVALSNEVRYKDKVRCLRTIPGIGLLTAMVLVTEIIDMNRFLNLDKLCSFMGLVPNTESSDTNEKVKGLTKRTNRDVRRILIQAAWVGARKAPHLIATYHKSVRKKNMIPQKAIIKVTKKLLSIVRALWISEQDYNWQL